MVQLPLLRGMDLLKYTRIQRIEEMRFIAIATTPYPISEVEIYREKYVSIHRHCFATIHDKQKDKRVLSIFLSNCWQNKVDIQLMGIQ